MNGSNIRKIETIKVSIYRIKMKTFTSEEVEKLIEQLDQFVEKIEQLQTAGNKMWNAMDMQLGRENESLHISSEVALNIYLDAMNEWHSVTGLQKSVKEEDYEEK